MQPLSDSSDSSKSRSNRTVGLVVILCVFLAAGLILPKAVSLILFPPSEKGRCDFVSLTNCLSLTPQGVQDIFQVQIGASKVLEAQTTHSMHDNFQYALLKVAHDDPDAILTGYNLVENPTLLPDEHHNTKISNLHDILVKPSTRRHPAIIAYVGLNDRGETLIYLVSEWNTR